MSKSVGKSSKTQCITLRIKEDKFKYIEKLSRQNNVSKNNFIVKCIDFALNNLSSEN